MSQILIVDDEPTICWALEQALTDEGHEVATSATAEDAMRLVESNRPDAIVLDIRLPGQDGLSALPELHDRLAEVPIIIITAFGSLDSAVQALNRGAFEYLTKPFDLDEAIHVIKRALEQKPQSGNCLGGAEQLPEPDDQVLLGVSPGMQTVFRKIAMVAERDVPVLVTGESGTGKELVATAIHRYSQRSEGPFVPVCIPAMNSAVIESELFGHTKGSFTGAVSERHGLLEAAHQGTAFFDEIGDIEQTTQIKLLRVLETKAISPVGGNELRKSDFRLVAATNRNLESMVKSGTFREDLFYRLNVFRIEIPPLRERPEDIPMLAEHFMRRLDPEQKVEFSNEAVDVLKSRPWYGNVRELRNVIEHAVIVTRSGKILPESLPMPMDPLVEGESVDSIKEAVERWWSDMVGETDHPAENQAMYDSFLNRAEPALLSEALKTTRGNRQEAARLLGIHRQTLREKLRRYAMNDEDIP